MDQHRKKNEIYSKTRYLFDILGSHKMFYKIAGNEIRRVQRLQWDCWYSAKRYQETTCVGQGYPRFLVVILSFLMKSYILAYTFLFRTSFLGHILELCRTRRKRLYVLPEINPKWLQMLFQEKLELRSTT